MYTIKDCGLEWQLHIKRRLYTGTIKLYKILHFNKKYFPTINDVRAFAREHLSIEGINEG